MNKKLFIALIVLWITVVLCPGAGATAAGDVSADALQQRDDNGWLSFDSRYCTIKYRPDVRLSVVNRRLRLYFRDITLDRERPRHGEVDEDEIGFKCDKLLRKVKKVLDMRPAGMKLTIKIFKSQGEVNDHYYSLFGIRNSDRVISYYLHSNRTIYTSEWAIATDVLAHEMAHAVMRHYFLVRPPTNVDELMAQYVERHLND